MNYAKEYDEYWSRPDRWQSHSFASAEVLVEQIETLCGRGPVLDAGCGMGLLVRTLNARGIDAHGVDTASRPIENGNRELPGHYHLGSIVSLPFPDESFDTVISTDCLEHIAEADVPTVLSELFRVTRRFAFIRLATKIDRDGRWHLCIHDRTWWEQQFFAAGFRKHALSQMVIPYESLEHEGWQVTIILEKLPADALAEYSLDKLQTTRDVHMDMFREAGRRSDAHIARYLMARRYLPEKGGVVLDAACGLGYGAALLAQAAPTAQIIGMDESDFAITYAEKNYLPTRPNLTFLHGDVCDLRAYPNASVDLVVAFEILAHLKEPAKFLNEARRILRPGGKIIGSFPNQWVDDHGRDPDPRRFHTFDFAKAAGLCGEHFDLCGVYRQTAGGGLKLPKAPRQLRKVQIPVTSGHDEAEWWLLVAEKQTAPRVELVQRTASRPVTVMTGSPDHSIYKSWLSRLPFPVELLNPAVANVAVPDNALLFVTHDTYTEPGRTLIRQAVAKGIPTLILADGVLDYRNTWEHPQIEPGAIFQPVLGHKIATIGRSQSRWLESWGNVGKCETVGLPRLDKHPGLARRERSAGEPFRILINTAITPYFTEAHRRQVTASLRDLKRFFEDHPALDGQRLEPIWRLTRGLDAEIGVSCHVNDLSGHEMAVTLKQVDAVITTPSTVILEGMFFGLPVAVLDYCNTPHYIPTAWRITAQAHIGDTISELINPPEPKLLFQETCLHDSLECHAPAAPRLLHLMTEMIECGLRSRESKQPLSFPAAILQPQAAPAIVENRFRMERLYSKVEPAAAPIAAQPASNAAAISDPASLRAFAAAAGESGRYSEAVDAYAKLLEFNRRDTDALLGKAIYSAMQQHYVLARIHLEELLEIEPNNAAAKKCLASLPAKKSPSPASLPASPVAWPPVPGLVAPTPVPAATSERCIPTGTTA